MGGRGSLHFSGTLPNMMRISTKDSMAGPPLPVDKEVFTALEAPPSIMRQAPLDTWLRGLSDRANPSRRTIIDILCTALSEASSGKKNFNDLPGKLLDACGSRIEQRQQMIQTSFLDGRSPIVWMILNLPDRFLHGEDAKMMPPVLSALLGCCRNPPASLRDSIHAACCSRNSNQLFQFLNPHARSKSSEQQAYTIQAGHFCDGYTFNFVINDFLQRMLKDGRVDLRFIHDSHMYSVGFAVKASGDWVFFHRVVFHNEGAVSRPTKIAVDIFRHDRQSVHRFFSNHFGLFRNPAGKEIPAKSFRDAIHQFVGAERALKGMILLQSYA